MPFRPSNHLATRTDEEKYDRHGIPRCKHCGGESKYVRFDHEPYPRIGFRCMEKATPKCSGVQSIACKHDFSTLLPLWRIEPAYIALRESHQFYERSHNVWRTRYRVGAATLDMRPKRRGIGCQQLRASAALLIEWLRVLDREGWLTGPRRNGASLKQTKAPAGVLQRLLAARVKNALHLPYGPRAVKLNLGPASPGKAPPT